jgi:GcrA cell cycle regulator
MGWTDERVETLKKLWQDGLSASQIAKQLGGVTRNAVIGKVHRLGLSGRAIPSKPARPVFKAPRPQRAAAAAPSAPRRIAEPVETEAAAPATAPVRYVDEAPGSATVLTLGAHMCKWPIGDPSSDSFTFCGRRCSDGPYCTEHARVAYQPAQAKKRAGARFDLKAFHDVLLQGPMPLVVLEQTLATMFPA